MQTFLPISRPSFRQFKSLPISSISSKKITKGAFSITMADKAFWRDPKSFAFENNDRWTKVDQYNYGHLHASGSIPDPELMEKINKDSAENGLPGIAVAPVQGKFLKIQAQLLNAKTIIEVGMLGGYSTVWMASSAPDVKVTSIEIDSEFAAVAKKHFEWAGVQDRIEVKIGSGMDVLPELVKEVQAGKRPKVDMVFIDANKENNFDYYNFAMEMAHPGTCIIVDNVVRRGGLVDPSRAHESQVQGTKRVIEGMGKDPRVDSTIIQTVGDKSYDGFLIAVVKDTAK